MGQTSEHCHVPTNPGRKGSREHLRACSQERLCISPCRSWWCIRSPGGGERRKGWNLHAGPHHRPISSPSVAFPCLRTKNPSACPQATNAYLIWPLISLSLPSSHPSPCPAPTLLTGHASCISPNTHMTRTCGLLCPGRPSPSTLLPDCLTLSGSI